MNREVDVLRTSGLVSHQKWQQEIGFLGLRCFQLAQLSGRAEADAAGKPWLSTVLGKMFFFFFFPHLV